MSVTPHKKYPGIWVIRYYPEGRRKDPKTGKPSHKRETVIFQGSREEAKAYYAELMRTSRGREVIVLAPTISQAWPDFLGYYKNKNGALTVKDIESVWKNHLKPFFGNYRPAALTSNLIEQYKTSRMQQRYLPGKPQQKIKDDEAGETARRRPVTKRTVTKELAYLRAIINWMTAPAQKLAYPLAFPINGFEKKHTAAPLKVIPDRRDVIMLLRKTPRTKRGMIAFLYYTGARLNEGLKLPADMVNISQRYVIIKGKGEKYRVVPVYRKLLPYLRKKKNNSEHMWVNPQTGLPWVNINKILATAAKTAGVKLHVHPHLFRHALAVHLLGKGASTRSVQMILGHANITTTEKYLALTTQHLRADMEKL